MARCLLAPLLALVLLGPALAQPQVILDTDFTTFGDDGQALVMLAQLHAEGTFDARASPPRPHALLKGAR